MNDKVDAVMDLIVEFGDDMHSFGERMDSAEEASRHFDNAKEGLIEIRAALEQLAQPQGEAVEYPPGTLGRALNLPYRPPEKPATVPQAEHEALKTRVRELEAALAAAKPIYAGHYYSIPASLMAALSTNPADEVKS